MDLSIIIVNFKSKNKLLNCLNSLRQADMGALDYEIIIVDNNSGDDLSDIAKRYQRTRSIASPKNLGMGGGNNIGIQEAKGEFILVLNPDTVIKDRAIPVLVDYLRDHPEAGLVGPKLLYPDGTLQSSCAHFPQFFMPLLRRTFLGDYFKESRDHFTMNDFDHNSIMPVDWLMGSCLLFRRRIVLADSSIFFPHFDERYFMYFEDTDLARQFWSHKQKVIYDPEAVVIHDHQRQSAKYPWYLAIFLDRLAWHHIGSWLKYFIKWGFKF